MNNPTAEDAAGAERFCRELLEDIRRWLPEVRAGVRSTLWHGVLAKAQAKVDALLASRVLSLLAESGEAGTSALAAAGQGKPVDALTMGQRVDLVRRLDMETWREIRPILDRLTKLRNAFVHGKVVAAEGQTVTDEFLMLAKQLCESHMFSATNTSSS
jgi:hypothetical protein